PHVADWQLRVAAWKADCNATPAGEPKPDKPMPTSWGARIETAIGKTEIAIKKVARAVKPGMKVVYAVPYHDLADEIAERFAAEGIRAQAYRGFRAPDPELPDQTMCLDLAAYDHAVAAGRGPVLT
ncbi:hypothetical protein, partial [Klebsiella pneumoniae]|uniref:hypothetical protein n=1 Tax=Klebsiella pneumoniae TaxID=573 RepID=UPI001F5C80C6